MMKHSVAGLLLLAIATAFPAVAADNKPASKPTAQFLTLPIESDRS